MDWYPIRERLLHFLLLVAVATSGVRPQTGDCTKDTSCSCKYPDGSVIDLTPIAKDDGTAEFVDVPDKKAGDAFSWNPCNPFTEGTCVSVAVCQVRPAAPTALQFSCGTQDSATFLTDAKGRLLLQYSDDTVTANGTNTLRTSNIILTCDQDKEKEFIVDGEQASLPIYDMELKSKYACPSSTGTTTADPGPGPSSSSGLSIGSILCIVFACVVLMYVVLGVTFQSVVRKGTGKERIPNYTLWSNIPSLIRTGIVFTAKRGKVTTYDAI